MKNVAGVFLPTMACLTLIAPAWACPRRSPQRTDRLLRSNPYPARCFVEKSSFTLTVGQSQTSSERQNLQQDAVVPRLWPSNSTRTRP